MARSQRTKVEVHGSLYLSPEGADWPNHPWWPGEPVGGGPDPDPAPALTSLDPNTAELNAPDITMHCHGSGFTEESVIVFAGQDELTVFISENEITTGITLSLPWGAVTVPVSVRNADGQETAELDFTFTEAAPAAAPVVTTLAPPSVAASSAAFTLTVDGTDFVDGAVVTFAGVTLATTFVSSTQVTAVVTAGLTTSAGTPPVTVKNPDLQVSNTVFYSVTEPAGAPPTLTSINPQTAIVGAGDTPFDVNGTGFDATCVVRADGVDLTTVFVGDILMGATIPTAFLVAVSTMSVTVLKGAVETAGLPFNVVAAADDQSARKTTRKRR